MDTSDSDRKKQVKLPHFLLVIAKMATRALLTVVCVIQIVGAEDESEKLI